MQVRYQTVDEIRAGLSPLEVSGEDETYALAVSRLKSLKQKDSYGEAEIEGLFTDPGNGGVTRESFEIGLLVSRLFLSLSKDEMQNILADNLSVKDASSSSGTGVTRFNQDRKRYLEILVSMGLPEAMTDATGFQPEWSDILIERLRSGRGKAIRGQQRGRNLEDFVEQSIQEIFQGNYEARCQFQAARRGDSPAKCDFAIPSKSHPRILIESKAYGATGSKMTDIIGDLNAIVRVKRHDTVLIFVTDGVTWNQRLSDLAKIVEMQNAGEITRIYTSKMVNQFRADLEEWKREFGL